MSVDSVEPPVATLEEMEAAIEWARRQLIEATLVMRELKDPYDAAVEERTRLLKSVTAMETALATAKAVSAIDAALKDAGIEFEGPRVVASAVYRGSQSYLLTAVGSKGTGLYLYRPDRSARYSGKEYVVRREQAIANGFDPAVRLGNHHQGTSTAKEKAGLVSWQARGKGDFGFSGGYRPTAPPEGGKWRWLKVREQESLTAREMA